MGQTENTILSKVALLLEKTKDALIYDLSEEFVGIKKAIADYNAEIDESSEDFELVKCIEGYTQIVDAVFAKVGYDISHYEGLDNLRDLFNRLIELADKLGETIKSSGKLENGKAEDISDFAKDVISLIQEIISLVRAITDIEWNNVKTELENSGEDITTFFKDNVFTLDFARKILDHILMTLLKNAKNVFKDEIDFVKLTIESGIAELTNDVESIAKVMATDINSLVKEAKGSLELAEKNVDNLQKEIQDSMKEALDDATHTYDLLNGQVENSQALTTEIAEEWKDTIVKISRALSITYSILEFLGVLEEKQYTLQLPKNFKDLLSKVQSAVNEASDVIDGVSDKIDNVVEDITDTAEEISSTVDSTVQLVNTKTEAAASTVKDTLKTTQEVTGIGIAASGTISNQLTCIEKYMSDGADGLNDGIASIAAAINGELTNVNNYVGEAKEVTENISSKIDDIKNFRYPIKINVVSWDKLCDLFTCPVEHFKNLYPINSMQDAEDLMTKIMGILHNINPDIPNFDSLKKLLEDLLRKLQRYVMKRINELKEMANDAAKELKEKIQTVINRIWKWFRPIVTTIRNVINTLKELAQSLRNKMGDVINEVKEGVELITNNLEEQFEDVKKGLTDFAEDIADELGDKADEISNSINDGIKAIENKVTEVTNDIAKNVSEVADDVEDGIKDAVSKIEGEANNVADEVSSDFAVVLKDIKANLPKLPKLNLPKMVKDSFAVPMTNAINNTLKDVVDLDLSSVIDFSQEVSDIKKCVTAIDKDFTKLKKYKAFAGLGISEEDLGLSTLKVESLFPDLSMPNIEQIVQQEVLPDLNIWAYGMVTTVKTLTDAKVWKQRLETVATQLKAEFQSDLGNITSLISKDGAMKLLNDSSSVKADLKKNINITDYINILETAVNDVVIPDPEYFYTSFKQCILTIISKLTARIIEEVNKIKTAFTETINIIQNIPDTLQTKAGEILTKLESALESNGAELGGNIQNLIDDIKAAVNSIITLAKKLPDTIEGLKELFTNKIESVWSNLKSNASTLLKEITESLIDNLEDLASQVWQRMKNEYIVPFLKSIKNQVIYFIKHIIREKLKQLVNAITDVETEVEDGIQSILNKLPTLKGLMDAERQFVKDFTPIYNEVKNLPAVKENTDKFDISKGITNLNQLPGLLTVIKQASLSEDLKKQFEELTLDIQFDIDAPKVEVPVEYIVWIQSILSATLEFVQSDMGVKEVITLVQSLYKGIPDSVKDDIAEVMPSLPSLPKNGFTDLLNDVTCSYDLDNKMCSITLLDLSTDEDKKDEQKDGQSGGQNSGQAGNSKNADNNDNKDKKEETVQVDASLKLQLFIMIGCYSSETFTEESEETTDEEQSTALTTTDDEEEEEEEDNTVPAIFFTVMLNGKVDAKFKIGKNHTMELVAQGSIGEALGMKNDDNKSSDEEGTGNTEGSEGKESTKGKESTESTNTEVATDSDTSSSKATKVTEKTVGFCLSKKDASKGVTSVFHGFGSTKSLGGILWAEFKRVSEEKAGSEDKKTESASLLSTEYLDIKIGNYPQTAYVLYNNAYPDAVATFLKLKDNEKMVSGFTAGYLGQIEDMEFVLKLRQNKFFSLLLKDDISAKFSLGILYDYLKGFKMDGGYSFHLDLDCNNKEIGPLTLANLGIDLGSAKNDFGTLHLGVGSTFSVAFGDAVTMSFDNLQVGFDLNVIKKDFSLGDFDPSFRFKFPDGIGVAIDCSAVKGSAIINYDQDTGELFGALELDVIEKFGVSAMLMLDLGIVDGHFFSMLAMLSARFSPGIPLGMGFSLTAIGGVLGLQRMIEYNSIRDAVHSGTLESAFFVEDVMKHIADMKKTAEEMFPTKKKQFFFGVLGQISYEPVVKCSAGLMLQLPDPTSIIIVGVTKVAIEGTDVIQINVAFSGEIDFAKGIQFDASLYDSNIVGISLEGDMAFRLFWGGKTKGFLLSIGGFHPAYTPEESMHVSDMRRLSMKLDYNVLKVSMETYLAVTSNTFQIGAHLDIKVGWNKFGIIGYAGFDSLFQFDPFMFMFDIEAGMAVMVGGLRVLSVDLALSLSGPRPWHAEGSASFTFILIPVSVDFDITWGKKKQELPDKQISVLEHFKEQIDNLKNWAVDEKSRRDTEVLFFEDNASASTDGEEQKELVLAPSGTLAFNQSDIPLEIEMDLCNNAVPTDYTKLKIDKVRLNDEECQIVNADETGNKEIEDIAIGENLTNDFAPALFKTMTNKEKLSSPSYEKYASGFTVNDSETRKTGTGRALDIGKYNVTIGPYKTHETKDATAAYKANANGNSTTGKRVAYKKTDMNAVKRVVKILDTIK